MSRQPHLPPRCPFQKKHVSGPIHDPISPPQRAESYVRHHKSSSQSSILEDQPAWLDNLLSDPGANSVGILHRRSASDSVTLLDGIVGSFLDLNPRNDDKNLDGHEACSGLESSCLYGPNSPRKRSNLTFAGNAIVSALSESALENHLLQYVDESLCISGVIPSDLNGDTHTLTGEHNAETKMTKRQFGQRSRVRKLQYIAELERTVEYFQTLQADLGARVALLLQQHVSLSMENSKLKQKIARVQKEKLIMEGQYQYLKKEAERLKVSLAISPRSKVKTYFGTNSAAEVSQSGVNWQMLDFAKLNLN
ncbi:hypothetical protein WN944_018879 [Citrus x changshan-huyou]|uniref:Uncharacterized protein n=1 Tax=Citrus x changshan-huyou TaxID=2935761 RepID=A0AAP0M0L3_9ROSI